MSTVLRRLSPPESLTLEVQVGIDGQGKPRYDSPLTIQGVVSRTVEDLRDTRMAHTNLGTLRAVATIWIDALQEPLPAIDDRITTEDGTLVGIVIQRDEVTGLRRGLDHLVLKLRQE